MCPSTLFIHSETTAKISINIKKNVIINSTKRKFGKIDNVCMFVIHYLLDCVGEIRMAYIFQVLTSYSIRKSTFLEIILTGQEQWILHKNQLCNCKLHDGKMVQRLYVMRFLWRGIFFVTKLKYNHYIFHFTLYFFHFRHVTSTDKSLLNW